MARIDAFMRSDNVIVSVNGDITRFLTAGTPKPSSWKGFVQVDVPGCSVSNMEKGTSASDEISKIIIESKLCFQELTTNGLRCYWHFGYCRYA